MQCGISRTAGATKPSSPSVPGAPAGDGWPYANPAHGDERGSVLGTGSGGWHRGPSQLYALHQARQQGTTTGRPLAPPSAPASYERAPWPADQRAAQAATANFGRLACAGAAVAMPAGSDKLR